MQVSFSTLLGLVLLLTSSSAFAAGPDLAALQEMLLDRQNPRGQCHAALLLVQDHSADAEKVVRQGFNKPTIPNCSSPWPVWSVPPRISVLPTT